MLSINIFHIKKIIIRLLTPLPTKSIIPGLFPIASIGDIKRLIGIILNHEIKIIELRYVPQEFYIKLVNIHSAYVSSRQPL